METETIDKSWNACTPSSSSGWQNYTDPLNCSGIDLICLEKWPYNPLVICLLSQNILKWPSRICLDYAIMLYNLNNVSWLQCRMLSKVCILSPTVKTRCCLSFPWPILPLGRYILLMGHWVPPHKITYIDDADTT